MKKTLLVAQALLGLVLYDVVLAAGKFKTVRRIVGRWKVSHKTSTAGLVDQIAQAVNLACVCYPRQVLCLQRSSVMACLMRSRGIRAEMILGAQKTPFEAHAWVEVDGRAINEKPNVQSRYQVWERC